MTGPSVIVELGERSGFFGGDMGLIHAAIKLAGCRKQYDRRRRAVAVPRSAADDVLAALEIRFGADVQIVQAIT